LVGLQRKTLQAMFYRSLSGNEPVRNWLLELDKQDRKAIGEDIATLEFEWPVGKPKCSPMQGVRGLYEVRSSISDRRIARIFFVIVGCRMVLLHGFIKKTRKTPDKDLKTAVQRMKEVLGHE